MRSLEIWPGQSQLERGEFSIECKLYLTAKLSTRFQYFRYVLLHHCMGGVDGKAGAWVYPEGGMGAVSQAIGSSAAQLGASIFTNKV